MYPDLAAIFQRHGYALAVHGSLARDFDLIAVPWVDEASEPSKVLEEVASCFAVALVGEPEIRGIRSIYTLACGFGDCAIDLSFIKLRLTH